MFLVENFFVILEDVVVGSGIYEVEVVEVGGKVVFYRGFGF